jgi:hypothetical protein
MMIGILSVAAHAADQKLHSKVAAAVDAALRSDARAFSNVVSPEAKLDVNKKPLEPATIDVIQRAFKGCVARPPMGKDPENQVTLLWDCKDDPMLAAFNFEGGKIVLIRTLPNFRPISPPSTERG